MINCQTLNHTHWQAASCHLADQSLPKSVLCQKEIIKNAPRATDLKTVDYWTRMDNERPPDMDERKEKIKKHDPPTKAKKTCGLTR